MAVTTRTGIEVRAVLKKARKLQLEAREDRTRTAIARLKRTDSTMRVRLRVNDAASKTRTTKSERSSHLSRGSDRRACSKRWNGATKMPSTKGARAWCQQ